MKVYLSKAVRSLFVQAIDCWLAQAVDDARVSKLAITAMKDWRDKLN